MYKHFVGKIIAVDYGYARNLCLRVSPDSLYWIVMCEAAVGTTHIELTDRALDIERLLYDAKAQTISQLVGKPIEVIINGTNKSFGFRILEEEKD